MLSISESICIDENYAFTSDRCSYVCVLVNFMTQEAIDILLNRFKTDLIRYFKSIPSLERANVKAVAMDMYPVYRDVVKECFGPKTLCVIEASPSVLMKTTLLHQTGAAMSVCW